MKETKNEKQYKTSAQKRAYQNEYNRQRRTQNTLRNNTLRKTARYVANAQEQHNVHFLLHENKETDTWDIRVEGEQGCCRNVPTNELPALVHALTLMGKKLRTLRMSDDWEKYYAHRTP